MTLALTDATVVFLLCLACVVGGGLWIGYCVSRGFKR